MRKKRETYQKRKQKDVGSTILTGVYKQAKGNFGFVDTEIEGEKKGYYVHESKKADAFSGDEVFFYTKVFKGREEAVITGVKQRAETLVVGKLQIQKTFGFVIPENRHIGVDIFIPGKFLSDFRDGQRVGVQVINWKGKNPEGRILESLPEKGEKGSEILKIALEGGARITFPQPVLQEAKAFSSPSLNKKESYRKDLRSFLTFTIDGEDSKDLDDALSIQKISDKKWKLFVHIADVADYVKENSELDREARKRGTSIYLVNKVIPMLPPELSNGVCSLHPGESKKTLTCEIDIDATAHVHQVNVYESIIESDFRLTYKEVQELLEKKQKIDLLFGGKVSEELLAALQELSGLKNILTKFKDSKGVLRFEFPETKIEVDDNEMPIKFYEYERLESHKIIEECMILANECIAQEFQKYPFLYRVHESPDEEDLERFLKFLQRFDIDISLEKVSPKLFQKILLEIEKLPQYQSFQKILLRSLMKAQYSEKNLGHFGLASQYYSHFTSPIRRYPDLQIHRIIKEVLKGHRKISPQRKQHYEEILPKVAQRSSDREVISEKIEYKVNDYMAAKYMKDKIGEIFTGKISGMIEKGFFVELPNTIEGFIDFNISNFSYDSENLCISNYITGQEFTFGDNVEVELIRVDMENYRIDFEML